MLRADSERPSRPSSGEQHHAVAQLPSVILNSDMEAFGNRLNAIVNADFYAAALAAGPVDVPLGKLFTRCNLYKGVCAIRCDKTHLGQAFETVPFGTWQCSVNKLSLEVWVAWTMFRQFACACQLRISNTEAVHARLLCIEVCTVLTHLSGPSHTLHQRCMGPHKCASAVQTSMHSSLALSTGSTWHASQS